MKGTRIVFPRYHPPPRVSKTLTTKISISIIYSVLCEICLFLTFSQNPELVARLEKIKKDLENEEYDRMVGKINVSTFMYYMYHPLEERICKRRRIVTKYSL